MSSEADLGPLLEALVTCVGVFDGITLLAYIFDRSYHILTYTGQPKDENNNEILHPVKSPLPPKPHKTVTTCPIPQVIVDDSTSNNDAIDALLHKVDELEHKVAELEIRSRESSVERLLEVERIRRSRSPTPYNRAQHSDESSSSDERYRRSKSPSPRVRLHLTRNSLADNMEIEADETSSIDDESNTTTQSGSQSREDSVKRQPPPPTKPITRDDEFRKTKRSSPHSPHESREDELAALTRIEREENENMSDFVPIVYEGHEDDVYTDNNIIYLPPVSPIQEDVELDPSIEATSSSPIDTPASTIDINENFIKMERAALQQTTAAVAASSPKTLLVKQEAHVSDEEFEAGKADNLPPRTSPVRVIEDINSSSSSVQSPQASSTTVSAIDKNVSSNNAR